MFFLLMLQGLGVFSSRYAPALLMLLEFSQHSSKHATFELANISVLPHVFHPCCNTTSRQLTIGSWKHWCVVMASVSSWSYIFPDEWSVRTFFGPRAIFSLIPVTLYLFALSYIPIPEALEPSDTTTAALSRLIVIGTIVLGLLSGFGAISNSWQFLPFGSRSQGVPSDQDIDTAQYALTSIRNDMQQRRTEVARRDGSTNQASWFSRVGSTFRGGDSRACFFTSLQWVFYVGFQFRKSCKDWRRSNIK